MPCTCYTELEFFPPHTHRLHPLPLLPFQKAPRLLRLHLPTREKATVPWSSSKRSRAKCCFFFFQLIRSKPKTETKVHFPALGIRCMFSRVWRRLHGSVSNSDWFTALSRLLLVPGFITALQTALRVFELSDLGIRHCLYSEELEMNTSLGLCNKLQSWSWKYTYYVKLIFFLFIFYIFVQLFKIWCKCAPVFLCKNTKTNHRVKIIANFHFTASFNKWTLNYKTKLMIAFNTTVNHNYHDSHPTPSPKKKRQKWEGQKSTQTSRTPVEATFFSIF